LYDVAVEIAWLGEYYITPSGKIVKKYTFLGYDWNLKLSFVNDCTDTLKSRNSSFKMCYLYYQFSISL